MSEVNELREQVKRLVDNALEIELELVYNLFEAKNKLDRWDTCCSTEHNR